MNIKLFNVYPLYSKKYNSYLKNDDDKSSAEPTEFVYYKTIYPTPSPTLFPQNNGLFF